MVKEIAIWRSLILAMLVRGDVSVFIWRAAGKTFFETLLGFVSAVIISLTICYFFTGLVKKLLVVLMFKRLRRRVKIFQPWKFLIARLKKKKKTRLERLVEYLKKKELFFVFLFNLIPFIPLLPTAIIIVVKLRGVKYGYPVLVASSTIRIFITTWLIWEGINLFI